MSYFRRAMGDGPITDPSQLDDPATVATVPPTRVDCAALPADSPFRAPGQPCAPPSGPLDWLLGVIKGDIAAAQAAKESQAAADATDNSKWLFGIAGLAVGYYLLRKAKR